MRTPDEWDALEQRLREAEDTLDAIRRGEVDAVVVQHPDGERVYTLETADRPYRVLVEHMQEGAVTLTGDGVALYCNRRFAEILGVEREALIGHVIAPHLRPADATMLSRLLARDQHAGRAAEVSLQRHDGTLVPVTLSAVDLPAEPDMPRVICVIATDLTHSRQRSHELAAANERLAREMEDRRSAEDRLAVALEAAGMGSWDIDLERRVVRRSAQADAILGLADVDIDVSRIDQTPASLGFLLRPFLDHEQSEVRAAFDKAMATGTLEFERRIRPDVEGGPFRWIHVKGRVEHRSGLATRLVGIVADVTERRSIELQLRQAQKMEAVGQLTGGIAHDFNNLLMVIGGSLEVLEGQVPDEPKAQRFFNAAKKGVERGATLNQQLLAFSRRQDLQARSVCVDDLLHSFETLLSRALGETVLLRLPPPVQRWHCRTDPHQLETAILNLGINARDAMPQGGTLTITTALRHVAPREADALAADPGSYVAIRVADNGTGMSSETAARIFDPFFTTKPTGKGTGLGLSQVYGFVRQSGGFIVVHSELERGTTIEICLPHTDEVVAKTTPGLAIAPQAEGLVLVVDDDENVREVSMALLAALGYKTVEASDAMQALATLGAREDIDLVFSDVIMPGALNGIDLAHRVGAEFPAIGVVLASGYTAHRSGDANVPTGVELLVKPFSREALGAALGKARRRKH
jgi:PAS domain S-box-containing protein